MRFSILTSIACLCVTFVAGQAVSSRTVNTEVAGPTTLSGSGISAASTSESRSANTEVSGPTTVSPTGTETVTTATTSDSRSANTNVSGPTTLPATSTAFAAPTARPGARLGMGIAAVGVGLGYVV